MSRARVVNIREGRADVFIGRPSKWGNPFKIGRDGTRAEVIQKYADWIVDRPDLMAAIPELIGKDLGCYCAPESCHGDVLAVLAEIEQFNRQNAQEGGLNGDSR